ncbi:MAG: primosomal protein N' [Caldilineaceae bacterium]|nr:primosomal protein N' [Caldilineaceae bacterium]
MIFVELIVNRPIRRSFRPSEPPAAAELWEAEPLADEEGAADGIIVQPRKQAPQLDTFHYHVPLALEPVIQPGHLVWAPFGSQEVQGVVVRLADAAPVPTRPLLRLARTEPVLTLAQVELALWIASYYVAPVAEALKLFLPPGLLSKADGRPTARAKRELQIQLLATPAERAEKLTVLARDTAQTKVLQWFLQHPTSQPSLSLLQTQCRLASVSAVHTLIKQGILTNHGEAVGLAVSAEKAADALVEAQGIAKYQAVLAALEQSPTPIWKSDLHAQVEVTLALLRTLQKAGVLLLTEKVRFRDPLGGRTYAQTQPPPLTAEQQAVWSMIAAACFVPNETSAPVTPGHFLLHGVTGSGKTEIYLRTIGETLARGRQAIVLVPEIALTPQTVARFAGRFPGRVTVIHSGLSQGERYDVWRHLREGKFDVVIGPRSALFAPLPRLGLIIIDEEHESSYKQSAEEWGSFTVFYDARTVARQLTTVSQSILILGSATPSLESYTAAVAGELQLLEMLRRVMGHQPTLQLEQGERASYGELPPVEIVDMRQELRAGHRSIFSRTLLAELHATLDAGEQAIIFLNRRGTRTFVLCRDCGHVQACTRCDVPLTFHEHNELLICHHCNQRYPIPVVCPQCQSKRIKYFGSGTQRVEETIKEILPRARLLRWDADTATGKHSHEEILRAFAAQEADILVGTQMIAKGLDFPLVTLVGVVAADVGLHLPDFRSSERTFQLLTQVAGRAGRSVHGGRVVFQTYNPEHYAIQAAAQHDYRAFYERELHFRQAHGYPPLRRLARLIYWDKKLEKAQAASELMAATLRQRLQQMGIEGDAATVLGPAPAFFARYRNYHRWHVLLRAPNPAHVLQGVPIPFGWRIDIDPVSML